MDSLFSRLKRAKAQRNALILSHYYEEGPIQDVADFVGDSLALAQRGQDADHPVVLLAGVVFMAESVKILSPEKTVLIPDREAGCSLVEQSPFEQYLAWRRAHPDAIAVTYVNSSADVKSITDVCVTSSNAEKVLAAIPRERRVLFGPDRNLGRYLSRKLDREMILWPGACEVHILFSARRLFSLKSQNPNAPVLAHPECDERVLEMADVIGSTQRLLDEVARNPAATFIVATEIGIFHQMKKARPDATLIQAPAQGSCACNECPHMKLNTLEKVVTALETLAPSVDVPTATAAKARGGLARMMAITRGEPVEWPAAFQE